MWSLFLAYFVINQGVCESDNFVKDVEEALTATKEMIAVEDVSSADPEEFKKGFLAAIASNPRASQALAFLTENEVNFDFYTVNEEQVCGTAAAFFYPPPENRIGICIKGGVRDMQSIVRSFLHEVLHYRQFNNLSTSEDLTYSFRGSQHASEKQKQYSMDPRLVSLIFPGNERQQVAREFHDRLSATDNNYESLQAELDQIEKFFFIEATPDGLVFSPKKPIGVSEEDFWENFQDKFDPKLFRIFYPGLTDWLAEPTESSNFKDRVQSYLSHLNSRYRRVREGLGPKDRSKLDETFEIFYEKENRVLYPLIIFCAELQANMQTEMLQFLSCQDDPSGSDCRGKKKYEQGLYSSYHYEEATFAEVEAAVEQFVKQSFDPDSGIGYGQIFTGLYRFQDFPEIFNAQNCSSLNLGLMDYQPS